MALDAFKTSGQLTNAEITFISNLSGLTYVRGDILYYNGTNLTNLGIGTANQVLAVNAGATAPEWQTNGGGGANTALSNLASVAINTTLVSDTDNTDALGTTAIAWSDLFLGSGAVITFNSAPSTADIALTHSSNLLTMTGGVFSVTGDFSEGVTLFNRTNAATNSVLGTMKVKATSAGDMTDGFGAAFQYYIEDTAATENYIGDLRLFRDGADNSGAFSIHLANAGSVSARLALFKEGILALFGTADSAAEFRLYEDTTDGTNYTAFKVGIQAADIVYTLPVDDGDAGEVLSTNGSGVLSWVSAGGVPTTITVANEATDADSFIAFFTAATGDLGPKTNANLTFNSSTGVLTAGQTISGSISGNAGTVTNGVYTTGAGSVYAVGSTGLAGGQTIAGSTLTNENLTLRANAADLTTGQINITSSKEATNTTTASVALAGGLAVAKRIYALDMTVTNAITGSVTGSAGSVAVGGITGLGTGVATALAVNVGSAGAVVVLNGALGTPSSGTVTNLTGTASININGTVGATTPTTVVGTTITVNTGLMPDANDGAYLGQSGTAFSDLFLASGAVINFDAANATITHSAGLLTINVPVSLGTANAFTTGTIELGHASANTLSASGGVLSIEGVALLSTTTGLALAGGTMTGNITLAENAAIALDPAGSADGKYTGITISGTAGAALAFGDLIYLDPTDSRWELADANVITAVDGDARGTLGICVLAAAGDGSATNILLHGVVRADTAFPALTINNQCYVSETAGDITQTQPTTADVGIRVVGVAITADEIYFNPSPDYITHT